MNHFIIDGFGLAFRSHYGYSLNNSNGMLTGCFYGFLVSIRSLKKRFPDFHFTIAWDRNATRKKEIYADYKSERPDFNLDDQIKDLKDFFNYLNVSQSECVGEEADDVIATLARNYSENGLVYIYSADKDLLQTVEDGKIIVIKPKSGPNPEKFYDKEAVYEKFGVSPSNLASFQAFRGDKIDGIPGVPRAPSKVLASLVNKYKTPQTIYSSLDNEKLTEYQRNNLLKSEQQVYTNYQLTKLKDDLDLEISDGNTDVEKLGLLFKRYQIRSITAEFLAELFEWETSFNKRQGPAVENYSLF